MKTGQCVLIGKYDESVQPGQATTVVEKLGDYLIEVRFAARARLCPRSIEILTVLRLPRPQNGC